MRANQQTCGKRTGQSAMMMMPNEAGFWPGIKGSHRDMQQPRFPSARARQWTPRDGQPTRSANSFGAVRAPSRRRKRRTSPAAQPVAAAQVGLLLIKTNKRQSVAATNVRKVSKDQFRRAKSIERSRAIERNRFARTTSKCGSSARVRLAAETSRELPLI